MVTLAGDRPCCSGTSDHLCARYDLRARFPWTREQVDTGLGEFPGYHECDPCHYPVRAPDPQDMASQGKKDTNR